jgi:hypothetical protein
MSRGACRRDSGRGRGYTRVPDVFRVIYKEEGSKGLYRLSIGSCMSFRSNIRVEWL